MMARTQISLEPELQKMARQRAADAGISLAEYVRRLVSQDLTQTQSKTDVSCLFDLGASGGSDIATAKDSMIAEALASRLGPVRA